MADVAAVTFLLEQVTEVIKGYSDLISGADKEFKYLKSDVEALKAILMDTAKKSSKDRSGRLIKNVNEIREIVYEVEDTIDYWLTSSMTKCRFTRGMTKFNLAKKVKSLREKEVKDMLEKAKELKRSLEFAGASKEGEAHERGTVDYPPIRQEKVVVLNDEEEKITGYLGRDQPGLDIIPIIGMPGLGKTTLTRKIFNDDKICNDFPIRIWVHFSQRFNSKDVLIQIMKYFTSNIDELQSKSSSELCNAVHAYLSQHKFLLVVDDVWSTEHWDAIKDALP